MSQFKKGDRAMFDSDNHLYHGDTGTVQGPEIFLKKTEDMRVPMLYDGEFDIVYTQLECLRLLTPLEQLL